MLEDAIREVFDKHGITSHPSSLYTDEVKKVDGQLIQSQVRKPEPELKRNLRCHSRTSWRRCEGRRVNRCDSSVLT